VVILNALRANQHSSRSLTKYDDYIMEEGPKIDHDGRYSQTISLVSFYLGDLLEQLREQEIEVVGLELALAEAQLICSSIAFPDKIRARSWKSIFEAEPFKDMPFVRFHPRVGRDLERLAASLGSNKRLGRAAFKIKNIRSKIDSLYALLEGKRVQGKRFNDTATLDLWKDGADYVIKRLEPVVEG
jgi:hypothetical protein